MSLFQSKHKYFKECEKDFIELYKMSYKEYINFYSESNTTIDLTNKILIYLSKTSDKKLPIELLSVFVSDSPTIIKSTLIESNYILFLKVEFTNGGVKYYYNDEPLSSIIGIEEFLHNRYTVKNLESKFYTSNSNDILIQIEYYLRSVYDYNYKLDKNSLIILESIY